VAPKGRAGTRRETMGCGDPGREVEGGTARTVQQVEGERHRDGPLEVGGREAGVGVRGALEGRLRGTLMRHRTGVEGGGWKEGGGGNPMEYRRKGEVGRVAHQLRCSEWAEASWNGRPGAP
jgi:hypothetical protein